MWSRISIKSIACVGPRVPPAELDFSDRATAIIGISDTGKSFVLDLIEYMLGGETLRRIPPEGTAYDTVLLSVVLEDLSIVTLRRGMGGGDVELLQGAWDGRTGGTVLERLTLNPRKGHQTISQFFLKHMGMVGVVLRKNARSDTENLTTRTLANVHLVNIHKIVAERSPVLSGQYIRVTAEQNMFRYLLTGVDDSALVTVSKQRKTEEQQRLRKNATLEFLQTRLGSLLQQGLDEPKLRSELREAQALLEDMQLAAGTAEEEQITQHRKIRRLTDLCELAQRRLREVEGLLMRFNLLSEHYHSDIRRLKALEEAATAVDMLAPGNCPLCGAPENAQDHEKTCEADLPGIALAAAGEVARIHILQADLVATISRTEAEKAELSHKILKASAEVDEARLALPAITARTRAHQTSLVEVMNRVIEIKDELTVFDGLKDLERSLKETATPLTPLPISNGNIPRAQTDDLAKKITTILEAWQVPGMERIFFDLDQLDIQINGKLRSDQGTGLRAVTHAAFTIGLMLYCLENNLPHPGFVVIDSPLNPYRGQDKPKPDEVALQASVHNAFYGWLARSLTLGQVIVLENQETGGDIEGLKVHRFQSEESKRVGFFPSAGAESV